jgi:hypothetical protein
MQVKFMILTENQVECKTKYFFPGADKRNIGYSQYMTYNHSSKFVPE